MGEDREVYTVLVGKLEGKRPLRQRHRWDRIIMDLREIGWSGVESVGSGQGLVAGCCEHDEPSGSGTMEVAG
jgi:hypothetical protein